MGSEVSVRIHITVFKQSLNMTDKQKVLRKEIRGEWKPEMKSFRTVIRVTLRDTITSETT